MFYSPLRYPGGKNKLSSFIAKICVDNNINGHYVEPYAGGASVALFLLIEGLVQEITINDKDKSIYAFWYSVLNHTDELCHLIESTEITVDNWYKQKDIQKNKETINNLLILGFSTLFLNRCNRSGIINAGIIGGVKQEGKYKINCRFNKSAIIERIQLISKYKDKINLFNDDALDLITRIEDSCDKNNTVFYFDPPYYLKANSLYMNHYLDDNHRLVAERIKKINGIHWIVSYDNVPEINLLYSGYSPKEFSFKHTAYKSREGKEILFFSEGIIKPTEEDWSPLSYKLKRINNNIYFFNKN